MKLRYGVGGWNDGFCYTLEECGHVFKLTRERVRQIEKKALRKVQHQLALRGIDSMRKAYHT